MAAAGAVRDYTGSGATDANVAAFARAMHDFGRTLTCSICHSFLKSPTTSKCFHTFCRECIVRSLSLKNACPLCKTECKKREMEADPKLERVLRQFHRLSASRPPDLPAATQVESLSQIVEGFGVSADRVFPRRTPAMAASTADRGHRGASARESFMRDLGYTDDELDLGDADAEEEDGRVASQGRSEELRAGGQAHASATLSRPPTVGTEQGDSQPAGESQPAPVVVRPEDQPDEHAGDVQEHAPFPTQARQGRAGARTGVETEGGVAGTAREHQPPGVMADFLRTPSGPKGDAGGTPATLLVSTTSSCRPRKGDTPLTGPRTSSGGLVGPRSRSRPRISASLRSSGLRLQQQQQQQQPQFSPQRMLTFQEVDDMEVEDETSPKDSPKAVATATSDQRAPLRGGSARTSTRGRRGGVKGRRGQTRPGSKSKRSSGSESGSGSGSERESESESGGEEADVVTLSPRAAPKSPGQQRDSPVERAFCKGQVVTVSRRMQAGMNRPGGAAKIAKVHGDGTYDVRYTVLGGVEKGVSWQDIEPGLNLEASSFFGGGIPARRRSRSSGGQGAKETSPETSTPTQTRPGPASCSSRRNARRELFDPSAYVRIPNRRATVLPCKRRLAPRPASPRGADEGAAGVAEEAREKNKGSKKKKKRRKSQGGDENDLSRVARPVVALTGNFGKEKYRDKLLQAIRGLGGRVENDDVSFATHLVAMRDKSFAGSRIAKARTLKLVRAVCLGKWVIDPLWVQRSAENGAWVKEDRFEFEGDSKSVELGLGGPKRARLARSGGSGGGGGGGGGGAASPLAGFAIFLCGPFQPPHLPLADVRELALHMGAVTLDTLKELREALSRRGQAEASSAPPRVVAVMQEGHGTHSKAVHALAESDKLPCVSVQWLLNCISVFQAQPLEPYSVT